MDGFPGSVQTAQTPVMVDRFPGWEVVRKSTPNSTAAQPIEDAIDQLPPGMFPLTPSPFRRWKKQLQQNPLRIA